MKIDDIRSNIIGDYGLATSNQYQFSFIPNTKLSAAIGIKGSSNPIDYESARLDRSGKLSFLCDELNIPGYSIGTGDLKGIVPGINIRYAHTKVFNELSLTFLLDMDHTPLRVMQKWSEYMFPFQSIGTAPDRNYMINNYYDDYCADIIIDKLEPSNPIEPSKRAGATSRDTMENKTRIHVYKAFPYTVANVGFSNGPNQPVKMQVSFYYEYLKMSTGSASGESKTLEQAIKDASNFFNEGLLV
jgi:hypothetical protein